MPFLPLVVRAKHCGAFRIHLVFSDNVEATVDFGRWLQGPIFEALKEPRYFARFFIDGGSVAWPNGADIAPETLYDAAVAEASARQLHATAVSEAKAVYKARQKRRRE